MKEKRPGFFSGEVCVCAHSVNSIFGYKSHGLKCEIKKVTCLIIISAGRDQSYKLHNKKESRTLSVSELGIQL